MSREISLEEYKNKKKKASQKRKTTTRSYNAKNSFSYFRKTDDSDSKEFTIDVNQYYKILKDIIYFMKKSAEITGEINFPLGLGKVVFIDTSVGKENVFKKSKLPDWNATLEYWYNNPEAEKNKVVIFHERKKFLKFFHKKNRKKTIKNLDYYNFVLSREFRKHLNELFREDKIQSVIKINS